MNTRQLCSIASSILLLFFGSAPAAYARKVSITSTEQPPYHSESLQNGGVLTDIVTAAFERAGHDTSIIYYPKKRAVNMAASAKADILIGANYSEEGEETFIFSQPYYSTYVGFIALKSLGLEEYNSLHDLAKYNIGVNYGYSYGEEFSKADYLSKKFVSLTRSSILMLFKGRIQLATMPFNRFTYELAQMEKHRAIGDKGMQDIVFLYPPLTRYSFHVAASLKLEDHESLMKDFNRGLIAIKSDGTYANILKKHGF